MSDQEKLSLRDAKTSAEALLISLRSNGIKYLLANAGSDFAPVVEAYSNIGESPNVPQPVIIPHESAAVGMAHGYYLRTGQPLAVMVHVNVGLANASMGLLNAMSDNIPIIMMSGRTPILEQGKLGARVTPIQYGQEMRDQAALVRESTKWDYELRYGEQSWDLATRAVSIAMSEPRGPVYVSLPREPLCETWAGEASAKFNPQAPLSSTAPSPSAVKTVLEWLDEARSPLIICQRGDTDGRLGRKLVKFTDEHSIRIIEVAALRNLLPSEHPMLIQGQVKESVENSDFILIIDSSVPWIANNVSPNDSTKIVHVGADPLFQKLPVRSFRTDLAICADPVIFLEELSQNMADHTYNFSNNRSSIESDHSQSMDHWQRIATSGSGAPMSVPWIGHCLSEIIDDNTAIFSERGPTTNHIKLRRANQLYQTPYSGGLGWAVPAALGAALADPDRLNIAVVGEGSHIFANPVACHQIAEANKLPVLFLILNNGHWNAVRTSTLEVFPDGVASKSNQMPLTSLHPTPSFTEIAMASRAYAENVEDGADLPGALQRAIHVIRTEKRHALLELKTDLTNPRQPVIPQTKAHG